MTKKIEMTYREENGYLVPNMEWEEVYPLEIGVWALERFQFLQEHKPIQFEIMAYEATLKDHLIEVQERAERMEEEIVKELMKHTSLSKCDLDSHTIPYMRTLMMSHMQAREIIMHELITV